jgi:phage tail sheath protein FI
MPISAERRVDLDAGAVNVLLDDPRGFLAMSEWTLSTDDDLDAIRVRRLLALLKRAARHFGERYVFEPHSPGFRRTVERVFRELLGRMYRGGAFTGASAAQGYRVLAGEAQNPAGSVEQGRFVVELRVAPAHPLEFLTVRLVQSREGTLAVEEA